MNEMDVAGICVQSELPISAEEVDILVTALEEEVHRRYPGVRDLRGAFEDNEVHVEFIDSALAISCERHDREVYACDMNILGVNYEGWDIYCKYEECLGWSSMAHELLHSVEKFYPDDVTVRSEHMTPWFFEEYGYSDDNIDGDTWWNTVEVRMWVRLVCNLDICIDYRDHWICEQ
jgi:hypothetical protein